MKQKQLAKNEAVALEIYGDAFVKTPRIIFGMMGDEKPDTRKKGMLLAFLFGNCYFEAGYVDLNGHKVRCERGEYVGSQAGLARLSGIPLTTVNRLLNRLEKEQLIAVDTIQGGSRIRVLGYDEFTASRKSAKKKTSKGEKTAETSEDQWRKQLEQVKRMGGITPKY